MGDVVITLPYLAALQRSVPETDIDFLTRREDGEMVAPAQTYMVPVRPRCGNCGW